MASVHFGTIPYEPYTAHKVQGKPYFNNKNKGYCCCNTSSCAKDIVYVSLFKDFRAFLNVFMSRVFVC